MYLHPHMFVWIPNHTCMHMCTNMCVFSAMPIKEELKQAKKKTQHVDAIHGGYNFSEELEGYQHKKTESYARGAIFNKDFFVIWRNNFCGLTKGLCQEHSCVRWSNSKMESYITVSVISIVQNRELSRC